MGKYAKKIFCGFRLSPVAMRELETLNQVSGLDKTAIVERGILNVRPVIEREMAARAAALRKLTPPGEAP